MQRVQTKAVVECEAAGRSLAGRRLRRGAPTFAALTASPRSSCATRNQSSWVSMAFAARNGFDPSAPSSCVMRPSSCATSPRSASLIPARATWRGGGWAVHENVGSRCEALLDGPRRRRAGSMRRVAAAILLQGIRSCSWEGVSGGCGPPGAARHPEAPRP